MKSDATETASCCTVRCLDRRAVAAARQGLDPDGSVRVAYTCQLSGREEAILLPGEVLAARLAERLPEARDAADAVILAALHSAELCECDVATLAGLADDDASARLRRLASAGLLAQRRLQGMHYFRLAARGVGDRIESMVAAAT